MLNLLFTADYAQECYAAVVRIFLPSANASRVMFRECFADFFSPAESKIMPKNILSAWFPTTNLSNLLLFLILVRAIFSGTEIALANSGLDIDSSHEPRLSEQLYCQFETDEISHGMIQLFFIFKTDLSRTTHSYWQWFQKPRSKRIVFNESGKKLKIVVCSIGSTIFRVSN